MQDGADEKLGVGVISQGRRKEQEQAAQPGAWAHLPIPQVGGPTGANVGVNRACTALMRSAANRLPKRSVEGLLMIKFGGLACRIVDRVVEILLRDSLSQKWTHGWTLALV